MKDYKLFPEELVDRRWMSNNSVVAESNDDFSGIISNIAINGEPGIVLMENARHYGRMKDGFYPENHPKFDNAAGTNPCSEQILDSYELCNLVESFPANHETAEEYYDTLKYAYLYAKSVTLVPTHCERANQIMLRNRRIGCSQSGIQQAIKKFGIQKYFTDFCDKGYEQLTYWDQIYSRWLGIPTSIRISSVKPSGTISLLAGATPGIHCTHSEYYLRTVRVSASSELVPKLRAANYRIEQSITDKNTVVVYFPVKEKNFTKSKYDISMWEQLTLVKELQYYWSDNAVSATITFRPEEIKDLKSAIEYFAPYVKALSFLPLDDHNYAQAPYQTITEEEFYTYNDSLKELDLSSNEQPKGEKYCSNDSCTV
jgi:adenosylcobalamin-dependent ribonucleoside-triphosphate reductase